MTIALIGQGNVAWHLQRALSVADTVIPVNSRTLEGLPDNADLYLIAVSDDAIESVAKSLPALTGIVAHTSGSVPMSVLQPYSKRIGVLYPLQTFTKGSELNYTEIPVFVEADNEADYTLLNHVAKSFSGRVYIADSERRKRLHVASVFACNYINHLWKIADDTLRDDNLSLDIMMPLIDATVEKVHHLSPAAAQTGPASRGDTKVTTEHRRWLAEHYPDKVELYRLLENSILSDYR